MTDPTYTHLSFLLDSSGSMHAIAADVEGGFAAFIEEHRHQPGRCTVTLSDFSDPGDYRTIYTAWDIADVPPLKVEPRGMTALLDAIGRVIHETGQQLAALPEEQRPGLVIVGIMTDGLENSSREWSRAAVKALIERQEKEYSWVFSYLGANQDAVEEGARMGMRADASLTYAPGNAAAAMGAYAASLTRLRRGVARGQDVGSARASAAYTRAERQAADGS